MRLPAWYQTFEPLPVSIFFSESDRWHCCTGCFKLACRYNNLQRWRRQPSNVLIMHCLKPLTQLLCGQKVRSEDGCVTLLIGEGKIGRENKMSAWIIKPNGNRVWYSDYVASTSPFRFAWTSTLLNAKSRLLLIPVKPNSPWLSPLDL